MNTSTYFCKVLGAALLFTVVGNSGLLPLPATSVVSAQTVAADTTYVVCRGDTLSAIARRYNVTVNALMSYNGLTTTTIFIGQRLMIPNQPIVQPQAGLRYIVQRGDTLTALAQRYGTTVAAIQQQNGLRSTRIQVGQILWLPSSQAPTPSTVEAIQFAPGATAATRWGTLSGPEKHQYTLRVLAGQTLAIDAWGETTNIALEIRGISDGVVYKGALQHFEADYNRWRGVVPLTQDYQITLNLGIGTGEPSNYTLNVSVPPLVVQPPPVTPPTTPTEQRIQFAPGASSATVYGSVYAGGMVRYHLWAGQGQSMWVAIGSNGQFVVRGPDGEPLSSYDGPVTDWQGVLPVDGEYLIEVTTFGSADDYSLTVGIE